MLYRNRRELYSGKWDGDVVVEANQQLVISSLATVNDMDSGGGGGGDRRAVV